MVAGIIKVVTVVAVVVVLLPGNWTGHASGKLVRVTGRRSVTRPLKPSDTSFVYEHDAFPFAIYPVLEFQVLVNEPVICSVLIDFCHVNARIDSGAAVSLMSRELEKSLNEKIMFYFGPAV